MQVMGHEFRSARNRNETVYVSRVNIARFKGEIELSDLPASIDEVLAWVDEIAPEMRCIGISPCGDYQRFENGKWELCDEAGSDEGWGIEYENETGAACAKALEESTEIQDSDRLDPQPRLTAEYMEQMTGYNGDRMELFTSRLVEAVVIFEPEMTEAAFKRLFRSTNVSNRIKALSMLCAKRRNLLIHDADGHCAVEA